LRKLSARFKKPGMKPTVALLFVLALAACRDDETVGAYGAADRVWDLVEIDGVTFRQRATLTFPENDQIAGNAPCNSYSGAMTIPYPWFEAGPLAVTRMTCPDQEAETRFFSALGDMTLSEVAGSTLILSNDDGREMLFQSNN